MCMYMECKSFFQCRLSRECRVWPSMSNAATRTLSPRRSLRQCIIYDFPMPAVPETIILSGGGVSASMCCFPWSCRGSALVVKRR